MTDDKPSELGKFKVFYEYVLNGPYRINKPKRRKVLTSLHIFDRLKRRTNLTKEQSKMARQKTQEKSNKCFNQTNGTTVFWIWESAFRLGVGAIFIADPINWFTYLLGVYSGITGALIVISHFIKANK